MYIVSHDEDEPGIARIPEEGHRRIITDEEMEVIIHSLGNSLRKNAVYTWKGERTRQGEILSSALDKLRNLAPPVVLNQNIGE